MFHWKCLGHQLALRSFGEYLSTAALPFFGAAAGITPWSQALKRISSDKRTEWGFESTETFEE